MKPRILSTVRLSFPLATALAALLVANSASATNLYWDTNGTGTAGSGAATGTWGSSAFWSTDSTGANVGSPVLTAATTNADDLFFAAGTIGGNGTVTVLAGSTQYAHSITFEEGSITLAPGLGATLNLGSATAGSGLFFANVSGGFAINTPIILNSAATDIALTNRGNQAVTYGATGTIAGSSSGLQTITIGGPGSGLGSSTFNGIISNGLGGGTVALTVNANSNNILAAANTYSGATNILLGNLRIDNAATFANTSAINLAALGRLEVNVANQSLAKLSIGGGGTGVVERSFLRYSQAQGSGGTGPGTIFGTVELNHASVNPNYVLDFATGSTLTNLITTNYTSALTLSGNASIDASAAGAVTSTYSTGGITASTAGAKTLTLVGTNTTANTISGAIGNGSGTIGILKSGAGNWILSGTNTYTGNTRVDAGTLQFTNQVSLYNNGVAATWTKDNLIVDKYATAAFNVGAAGQFTAANINTLIGLSDSASNGFMSGSNVGLDTTGGSLVYSSVIANPNSGANVLGLTKLGTNTLTLDQANTYTGRTLISGGILQLGNGGTTGSISTTSTIFNNGTLTINRSNAVAQGTDFSATPISGTGAFIQLGTGTTTLNAANTFTGTTTVTAGTLALTNALAIQNSALNTTGAGFVTLSSATPTFGGLSNSGTPRDLATVISTGYGSVTNLTLNPGTGASNTYGGIIADGATGMTLTKTGAGTQILSGVNSYTGATTINGGTLTVGSGTTGSLASTVLNLGGGTLNYARTGSVTQAFTTTNLNAGASGATVGTAGNFLKLGDIVRNAGGTLNVGNVGAITTTDTNVLGILGGWATYNNENWAVANGDASAITALGTYTAGNATAATYTNANIDVATATVGGTINANSLRFSGGSVKTLTLATGDNILQSGGILVRSDVGNNLSTITGGNLLGSASGELIVHQHNTSNSLTIASVISNNGGATGLTKSGAGNLNLTGTNLYTGTTIVNAGTLTIGSLTALPVSANVTVNPGGTFNYGIAGNHRAYNVALNGGTLSQTVEGITLPGTFTLGTGTTSTLSIGGRNNDITGGFTGAGNLIITGNNTAILTGTNNYTGTTTLSGTGNTIFGKPSALYNGNSANWTPANITVNSGAIIGFAGGNGTTGFTSAQINTILGNLSTVNNNGLLAGSSVLFDTRASAFNHSGVITDSTGPGGGSVGVVFFGNAGGGLTLSGANTFTGRVSFRALFAGQDAGLSVSSFNSVFTNPTLGTVHSASSNLGAPTTVANGTIALGNNNAQMHTFLTYTGTGETTDRVIAIEGNGSSPTTISQSGSGLLKFTSPFAANSGDTPINLRGVGNGEVAGFGANGSLTKLDSGTWTIAGRNGIRGLTTLSGGALVLGHALALNGGIGSTGGVGGLTFSGGVLGLGAGDFSRPLAAAGTAGAVTFTGAGGWAAYGAGRTVNLGGASASITWATANTGLNGQTLILGSATSTHTLDFQNPLDMGAANRTVQVDNGSAAIDGKLSGILSGAGGSLTKTGLGTLVLTGNNSYSSTTTVNGGTLLLDMTGTGALASTSALTLGDGNFSIKGAATSAQTMGALTLTAGTSSRITLDPNNGTSTTLTLGNAWTRNAGSSLLIDYSSSNTGTRQVVTAGATTGYTLSNGIYGGILVKDSAGVTGFATRAAGATQAITRYDDTTGTTLVNNSNVSGTNFTTLNTVYTSGTLDWNSAITTRSVNSLTIDTTNNGGTINMGLSTNILTLTSGAILFKGANNSILTGGQVGAAASEVVVHQTGTGSLTINSIISSGAGSLTKDGTGTLIVGGTNNYTGATRVHAGTLQFAKQASLYNGTPANWTAARINVKNTATLALNVDSAGTNGFTATNLNTLLTNISVANNAAEGLQSGATLAFDTSTATGGTFTQGNAIANSTGASGGAIGLTKLGAGTLILDKTNTYTGATTVSAGTLIINGSTSSTSLVTVNNGATLGGSGTIGGNTSISGNHNPGNSPGIQTFSNNLAYTGGSSAVNWELVANTVGINPNPNANFDQIIVGGNLDFTDLTTLNLTFNASGSGVIWSNTFWNTDQSWLLYDVTGTTSNFSNLSLNAFNWLDSGSNAFNTVRSGNTFTLTQSGNDIYLNYTVVPEPRTALLGGLGVLALLRRRRNA